MVFNLLFPLWLIMTPVISFGAAADAKAAKLALGFAVRLRIFLLLVRVVLGYQVLIVSGLRTGAEQDALHRADPRNPPAKTGSSHQAGKAVDLNFSKNGVPVLLKATSAAKWRPVYELAKICGIKNGSAFTGYPDNNHFYI